MTADALTQRERLADVDHLIVGVLEEVNARPVRQRKALLAQALFAFARLLLLGHLGEDKSAAPIG